MCDTDVEHCEKLFHVKSLALPQALFCKEMKFQAKREKYNESEDLQDKRSERSNHSNACFRVLYVVHFECTNEQISAKEIAKSFTSIL